MREVELKSVVADPDGVIAALREAGAERLLDGRLHDMRFDTPDGALLARDQVLRLRVFSGDPDATASLDFKGPTRVEDGFKVREETSAEIGDPDALAEILRSLGFAVIREIERDIAQYELHGAAVRLERYPRMDTLVEVEGHPESIEAAIAVTGLPREGFTAERLAAFVARYEARTGRRAALCERELNGEYPFSRDA